MIILQKSSWEIGNADLKIDTDWFVLEIKYLLKGLDDVKELAGEFGTYTNLRGLLRKAKSLFKILFLNKT